MTVQRVTRIGAGPSSTVDPHITQVPASMRRADLTVKAPNGLVGFVELWRFAPDGQIDSVPEAFSERFVGI